MTDTTAALRRAQINRMGAMDASIDAPRSRLTFLYAQAFDDRAALAQEVERLTALTESAERVVEAAREILKVSDFRKGLLFHQLEDVRQHARDYYRALATYDDTHPATAWRGAG